MRNLLYISIALLMSAFTFGQQQPMSATPSLKSTTPMLKNEVRFNVATAVAGLPELTYEGFIADNVGLGMSVAVSVESVENMRLRSMFLPFARIYFSGQSLGTYNNEGFFIEGNLGLVAQRGTPEDLVNIIINNPPTTEVKSYFNAGFGAAVGWKFLTKNNYVGEFYGGIGRLFGDKLIGAYPRVGISLGKRF